LKTGARWVVRNHREKPVMTILLRILIVALAVIGLIHLTGIKAIRDSYAAWGYPSGFHYVTGLLEIAAVVMLAVAGMRVWGIALGTAICIAALVTLLWRKQWSHLPGPLLFLAGFAALGFL
jgi:DoxX-like protein